jgi:hypothetical protein
MASYGAVHNSQVRIIALHKGAYSAVADRLIAELVDHVGLWKQQQDQWSKPVALRGRVEPTRRN